MQSKKNFLLSLSIFLALLAAVGCHPSYPMTPVPPSITETLDRIDSYRAGGERRSIADTISEDASFLGMGDRVTTAGRQFSGPICRIQMKDVLLTTLKNNRNVRVADYDRSIARDGIEAARGIYDLLVESSYNYSWNRAQSPVYDGTGTGNDDLLVDKRRDRVLGLSLSQLVPSGGILRVFSGYGNTETWAGTTSQGLPPVDPADYLNLGMDFIQPLLRGFGTYVTNAPIQIAALQDQIARENFRGRVIDELASAVNLYWDLVFAIANHQVQQLSLERARELLRVTVLKRDIGAEAPNVVLQAEAEVSRREALLIDAQRTIADVADQLKKAMNLSETSEEWQYNLIPVDRPSFDPIVVNEEAAYVQALELRPDYRALLYGRDLSEVDLRLAENAKQPRLDALLGYEFTGVGASPGDALDSMETGNYRGWNAGLQFAYPLQNRRALHVLQQKTDALEQKKEQTLSLEELIRLQIRTVIRQLDTSRKLISAFDSNVKAEEAKLDAQIKRFNVGLATIFEVLQFQEDLANAQVNYIQSIVSYNKALIELQRTKASFLQDHRVEFQ